MRNNKRYTESKAKSSDAVKQMEGFYSWMLKIKSIHLADNERMSRAYQNIYNNAVK